MRIAIIGLGEAGKALAQGWRAQDIAADLTCFDLKITAAETSDEIRTAAERLDVKACSTLGEAIERADLIVSLVTAGSALSVAAEVAEIAPASTKAYFDMNSVSPGTKVKAAALLEAAGMAYIDTAVMAPIHPRLHKTPMLLAGQNAEEQAQRFADWGMDVRVVGQEVGRASSIKMLRSVMIKGLEALTAEMGLAAVKAGVQDEVIASLDASFPGISWADKTTYNLERMATHGVRRAEEMEEVVKTLRDLGITPEISEGTVRRQRRFGESSLELEGEDSDLSTTAARVFQELNEI